MPEPLVAQVLWTLGRAGAERMVFDLSRRLPAAGFRVRVIAAGGGEMAEDFVAAGLPLAVGPETGNRWRRGRTIRFFELELQRASPAIVHTHLGADVWAGSVVRRLGAPWIITAHSQEQSVGWLRRRLRRFAFQHADHVVAVSDAVRYTVRDAYQVPPDRLSLIRIGIDLKHFKPRPHGPVRTPARLLTVGRLVPEKNHATLLKALKQVRRAWRLDLIGHGPEERHLRRLADELKLADRIRFLGTVPDVAPHLADADLFCFPSLTEGQGLSLIEAAAAGLPIVAAPLPVFRETFDEASLLFTFSHSAKAWAHSIEDALAHYPAALSRAAAAREIVEQQFNLERMVEAYAELYRKRLSERGKEK